MPFWIPEAKKIKHFGQAVRKGNLAHCHDYPREVRPPLDEAKKLSCE